MARPAAGLALDAKLPGGYSKCNVVCAASELCETIVAGGLPVILPHERERAWSYLKRSAVAAAAVDFCRAILNDSIRESIPRHRLPSEGRA